MTGVLPSKISYRGGTPTMKSLILSAYLILSGCGVIYIVPDVSDQLSDTAVTVLPLNRTTAQQANQSDYVPRTLPAAFFQNAGAGGGLRGAGALPDPALELQNRPGPAGVRLPDYVPPAPYELGVGDVVVLATPTSASTVEELSGLLAAQSRRQGYTVQDDGAIAIPDVGRVQIAGLNMEEAESVVFQALVASQLDPTFSIEVAEFNSKRVAIGGAVRNPTVVPITLTPLTLQEAISAAGGVDTLDTQFMTVRLYRNGTLYQVPLDQLPNVDVRLLAGDSIFVDADYQLDRAQAYFTEQITLATLRQSARSQAIDELQAQVSLHRAALSEDRANFEAQLAADAIDRDFVYLTGEVAQQGRFPLPFGRHATLADALFTQGGALPETGNPAAIYLLRGDAQGAVSAYHLDGSNAVNLLHATVIELRPNDIVFVAQQPVTRWNRTLQQMIPSLIVAGATQLTE